MTMSTSCLVDVARTPSFATGRTAASSYDDCPYESHPYRLTHPDHVAAVATVFGMTPAPIERCRVLELGCAGGGNLIPVAASFPGSRFVGIDLSARQVADGQKVVSALGLGNIELRPLSILEVDRDFGQFDYIICHGVFSWVPRAVQDKILEICSRNLAPQGVAFVSYNTYPGWHMSGTIRDMLCYHARRFTEPQDRATQARALLNFLVESVGNQQAAYGSLLKEGLEVFRRVNDSYLLHEYLEEVNEPLYFHQFVERAQASGLQYLAEAEVHTMVAGRFGAEVAGMVEKLSSDCIEMEQFLDFLRNRKFRQTLLCHRDVALQRKVGPARLWRLCVASALKPVSPGPDVSSPTAEEFRNPLGRTASSTDPALKAALVHLVDQWPQAVPFTDLIEAVRARLGPAAPSNAVVDSESLGRCLLQLYSANLVELHARRLPLVRDIANRPKASPLARHQASIGPVVTNQRHELISLNDLDRQVLLLLDGSRNRFALLEALTNRMANGAFTVQQAAQPVQSREGLRKALNDALDQSLAGFMNRALLVYCS